MATEPINEEEEEEDGFDMGGLGGMGGMAGGMGLMSRKFEPTPLNMGPRGKKKPPGHQRKATPVMDPSWVLNANANRKLLAQKNTFKPQAGNIVKPARWNYTGPASQFKQDDAGTTSESSPATSLPAKLSNLSVGSDSPPQAQDVSKWSVARVRMWAVQKLQAKFVDKFCAKIDKDRVTGPQLLAIDDTWLKAAGFNVGFHRKVIMKRINLLKPPPPRPEGELRIGDAIITSGRRGTVRFVGDTHFGQNLVGVELDAPKGDNDGTFDGKRYFQSRPRHGIFTRTSACELIQGR